MVTKRELIAPNGHRRYVRRDRRGRFTSYQVDAGRSLANDRRRRAETGAPRGQGDRGDHRPRS